MSPIISFAWFAAEEWPKLLAVADDRHDLHDTHAEFEAHAGRKFDAFRARGHAMEKVEIRVEDLVAWCRSEGRPIDGAARSALAVITKVRRSQGH